MTDLKKYDSQTVTRLVVGGILILFIIGDGLIYLIYGVRCCRNGIVMPLGGNGSYRAYYAGYLVYGLDC